ncbi:MAG: TonB-dependent receptor [Bacteroidota bacterium]
MNTIFTRFAIFFAIFFAAFSFKNPVFAQSEIAQATASTGTVTGTIVNATTQEAVSGATVTLVGTKVGSIANSQGKFVINNAPAGVYSLKVTALGYEAFLQSDIVVSTAKAVTVTVEMRESAVQTDEVIVTANYFQKTPETITSTQILGAEEIRRAPGVQEDVVRAVALLPGVGVTSAGRNDLVVRGGAPFENLFVVDNIEVPNINHFGSQGSTGGPLSLINIDFVREASFSAGGFGAKYGDKVSSLTNITLREGNEEAFGGEVNLSATGFGVIGEGPLGQNGNFLFSARRSYLDFIFKAAGLSFIPQYWDFQTKLTHRFDEKNSLSFLTIGALNSVEIDNDDAEGRFKNSRVAIPNQQQYFSGLTWKHLLKNGFMNVTLGRTFTNFDTFQNDSLLNPILKNSSAEGENSLRADVVMQAFETGEIDFGANVKYASKLEYDLLIPGEVRRAEDGTPQPLQTDTSFTAFRGGAYATLVYPVSESFRVTAGSRLDYYAFLKNQFYVSPRVSASYSLTDVSSINASAGRYYQAPSFIWLVGDRGNSERLDAIRADMFVLGYEHILASDLKFQVEAYFKMYGNYPARLLRPQAVLAPSGFDDIQSDIPFGLEPLDGTATGEARGIEFFMQKKLAEIPLYGLISLSINQTSFTSIEGKSRPSPFDSRVIFNIASGYRFSPEWEFSAKFRLATGVPTTPFITSGTRAGSLDFSQYNEGERLPIFHALDARLDKRWNFTNVQLVTYIDVQNVYNRKNFSAPRWNQRTQRVEQQTGGLGILPSIGVNVEF